MTDTSSSLRSTARKLGRSTSGLAMLEFAFAMPIVLGVGSYGVEICNLALLNLRVSQIAMALADNASRVGSYDPLSTQQLREVDVNDVLFGVRKQGESIKLTTQGRVILSSLENVRQSYDTGVVQRIHWQRCVGLKNGAGYDSSYGTTSTSAGTTELSGDAGTLAPNGMGDPGSQVLAPPESGVMFVEINYLTKPLFGTWLTSPTRIHYIASFIVRDRRNFKKLFNPSPEVAVGSKMTCNRYTT